MHIKRAKIFRIVQSIFLLVLVLTGCDKLEKAPVSSGDPLVPVVEANVWIDSPLDGTTVTIYSGVAIIAHGYVETGVNGFSLQIGNEAAKTFPMTIHDTTLPYEQFYEEWIPLTTGWQTIQVSVLDANYTPVANAQVEVYVQEEPEQEAEELPTETPTEVPYSRCDLFDQTTTTLTLHDVPVLTTDLTAYFTFSTLVPGLEEEIPGDLAVWEYSALLGEFPSNQCTYRGYSQRLYCTFSGFPEWMFGTTQTVKVFVNLCEVPILTFERVSVLKPACEPAMGQDACEWTDGDWQCARPGYNCKCVCP